MQIHFRGDNKRGIVCSDFPFYLNVKYKLLIECFLFLTKRCGDKREVTYRILKEHLTGDIGKKKTGDRRELSSNYLASNNKRVPRKGKAFNIFKILKIFVLISYD